VELFCLRLFRIQKKKNYSRVELASIQYSTRKIIKKERNQYSLKKDHSYNKGIFQTERKEYRNIHTTYTRIKKKRTNKRKRERKLNWFFSRFSFSFNIYRAEGSMRRREITDSGELKSKCFVSSTSRV